MKISGSDPVMARVLIWVNDPVFRISLPSSRIRHSLLIFAKFGFVPRISSRPKTDAALTNSQYITHFSQIWVSLKIRLPEAMMHAQTTIFMVWSATRVA
jgi:hypothetical protein